jgi:predicted transcriptional regulator
MDPLAEINPKVITVNHLVDCEELLKVFLDYQVDLVAISDRDGAITATVSAAALRTWTPETRLEDLINRDLLHIEADALAALDEPTDGKTILVYRRGNLEGFIK